MNCCTILNEIGMDSNENEIKTHSILLHYTVIVSYTFIFPVVLTQSARQSGCNVINITYSYRSVRPTPTHTHTHSHLPNSSYIRKRVPFSRSTRPLVPCCVNMRSIPDPLTQSNFCLLSLLRISDADVYITPYV